MKLGEENHPCAGMKDLVFETTDGVLHKGRYDFTPVGSMRRWIETDTQIIYSSKDVVNWWK